VDCHGEASGWSWHKIGDSFSEYEFSFINERQKIG